MDAIHKLYVQIALKLRFFPGAITAVWVEKGGRGWGGGYKGAWGHFY